MTQQQNIMPRQPRYAGGSVILPNMIKHGSTVGGPGTIAGNAKKMHFAPGLGDGNMMQQTKKKQQKQQQQQHQGLRGNSKKDEEDDLLLLHRNKVLPSDDVDAIQQKARYIKEKNKLKHNQGNFEDDAELIDYLRSVADRRAALPRRDDPIVHTERGVGQTVTSDGPWQLSVIMLLGMIGILVGLFIHFSTDPSYLRRTRHTMKKKMLSRPSYRKKTDEWGEDEETTEDDNYRGDTEGAGGNTSSGGIAKKRMHNSSSPVPNVPNDPTARMYYPLNTGDNFRQQEHRLRKSFQQTNNNADGAGSGGSANRPSFHSPTRPNRQSVSVQSGNSSRGRNRSPAASRMYNNTPDVTPSSNRVVATQSLFAPPPPFGTATNELGSGLEGFQQSVATDNKNGEYSPADASRQNYSSASPVEMSTYTPVITGLPIVKPMGTFTPTESFGSLPFSIGDSNSSGNAPPDSFNAAERNESLHTPDSSEHERNQTLYQNLSPIPDNSTKYGSSAKPVFSTIPNSIGSPVPQNYSKQQEILSSPRPSPHQFGKMMESGGFSELPTPRVDHTRGKRELAQILKENGKTARDFQLPAIGTPRREKITENNARNDVRGTLTDTSQSDATNSDISDLAHIFPDLPLVPSLNNSSTENEINEFSRSNSFHVDAPRSVLLEELRLFRMESGVSGPKWRSKYDEKHPKKEMLPNHLLPPTDDDLRYKSGGQSYHHPMFGAEENAWYESPDTSTLQKQMQESENMEKLREASSHMDPADDPRNSIQHVRTDLTVSSDASSSLSSKITFSELRLQDIIGGGGFGQVWRATWKGTPVAVKVLTGSAQAEMVPKSVLEEFIAEINLVSGMRHPNVCLFMGACLDPPNRAIITELCENGSLWDALRSPLGSPYHVADGKTREAWPLNLYESMTAPPTRRKGSPTNSPIAPAGVWPWILVKRVAAGSARGMTYLHGGNPPVLHRDLKSANILLDESYTAKLADFGLSRLKAVRSGMTGNCGTVQWMAPEVLCSEEYAEPADVFSFGIILWEMLTNECPYEGMTPIQCALSVLNENKRPEIPDWCPQPFRALIKNCMERDPKLRPTFPQILAALDSMP